MRSAEMLSGSGIYNSVRPTAPNPEKTLHQRALARFLRDPRTWVIIAAVLIFGAAKAMIGSARSQETAKLESKITHLEAHRANH